VNISSYQITDSGKGLKGKKIVQLSDYICLRQGVVDVATSKKVALKNRMWLSLTGMLVDVEAIFARNEMQT